MYCLVHTGAHGPRGCSEAEHFTAPVAHQRVSVPALSDHRRHPVHARLAEIQMQAGRCAVFRLQQHDHVPAHEPHALQAETALFRVQQHLFGGGIQCMGCPAQVHQLLGRQDRSFGTEVFQGNVCVKVQGERGQDMGRARFNLQDAEP